MYFSAKLRNFFKTIFDKSIEKITKLFWVSIITRYKFWRFTDYYT